MSTKQRPSTAMKFGKQPVNSKTKWRTKMPSTINTSFRGPTANDDDNSGKSIIRKGNFMSMSQTFSSETLAKQKRELRDLKSNKRDVKRRR